MKSNLYRRIMIATDGSENAKKAASFGMEIATLGEAKVYAVHVMPTITFSSISEEVYPGMPSWDKIYDALKEEGNEIIENVQEAGKVVGVQVEPVLLEGDPANEIIDFAEKNAIDLIVIGTTGVVMSEYGIAAIERFLLGSVAEKVVRNSKLPVMVVR